MDEATLGVAAAAHGGAAVGVERQWSGHASGPRAHFAGVRTFTLLGGIAGLVGWLSAAGWPVAAAVLLAGAVALVVAGYVAASRTDVDGTTEVAALVVLAAGVAAGLGHYTLASAVVALTCLILVEKSQLHRLVKRLDDVEIRAGARFAVMAVVILPLLPAGPYGPLGGVRPRALWILVLLFTGLGFAGYAVRQVAGAGRGYRVAGLLGGLVSSTSVTLAFARESRAQPALGNALAAGVLAACTVMFVRVPLAAAVLQPALAQAVLPLMALPALVGAALVVLTGRREAGGGAVAGQGPENPLQLAAALQMAALFQLVLFAVHGVRALWGDVGLLASGALMGLTDADAVTVAMASSVAEGTSAATAAVALALGALTNTLVKLGLALGIGAGAFRRTVALELGALAAATAAMVVLW